MRFSLLIMLSIFFSCESAPNLQKLVQEIEDIEESTMSIKIEVDSPGNILDTIEVMIFKEDKDGHIVYDEYVSDLNMKSYFFNEDLIYRTSQYEGFNSEVTTEIDPNYRILKMKVIETDKLTSDTLNLFYKYEIGENDKVEIRNIYESEDQLNLLGTTYYNENQRKTKEFYFEESDTSNKVFYEYQNNRLIKSTKWYKYKPEYHYENMYDTFENVSLESTYENDTLIYRIEYQNLERNRPDTQVSSNIESGQKRLYKFDYK